MRATLCTDAGDLPGNETVKAWFSRWESALGGKPRNHGCGCCVNLWNVDVPARAIAELPIHLLAMSDWADRRIWSDARDIPRSWTRIDATSAYEAQPLLDELWREVAPGHALHGKSARPLAQSVDGMQVVFAVGEDAPVAQVTFTWAGQAEAPPSPETTWFPSWDAWRAQLPRDDDDWY
ncbi:MAG: hypothetical protein U0359_09555 [Byssovorax sp.]